MRMTLTDWALLFFLSVLWGGAFFFALVTGLRDPRRVQEPGTRQDFLFLCGECAGLVLHWQVDRRRENRY